MSRRSARDIAVVVPVRNRETFLPGLLAALDKQTLVHSRFEVIIADDSSATERVRSRKLGSTPTLLAPISLAERERARACQKPWPSGCIRGVDRIHGQRHAA